MLSFDGIPPSCYYLSNSFHHVNDRAVYWRQTNYFFISAFDSDWQSTAPTVSNHAQEPFATGYRPELDTLLNQAKKKLLLPAPNQNTPMDDRIRTRRYYYWSFWTCIPISHVPREGHLEPVFRMNHSRKPRIIVLRSVPAVLKNKNSVPFFMSVLLIFGRRNLRNGVCLKTKEKRFVSEIVCILPAQIFHTTTYHQKTQFI